MVNNKKTGHRKRPSCRLVWTVGLALLLAAPMVPTSVGAGPLDDDAGSGRDAPDHRSQDVLIDLARIYEGNLTGNTDIMDYYTFFGTTGDHLQFRLKGFDACWAVRDEFGRTIVSDCEGDTEIDGDFTIDDDGPWFLAVKRPVTVASVERYRFTLAENGTAADPWPDTLDDPSSGLPPTPDPDELPDDLPGNGNGTDPGNDTEPVQSLLENVTGLIPDDIPAPDPDNATEPVRSLVENVTGLIPDDVPAPDPDNATEPVRSLVENVTGMLPDELPDPENLTGPVPDPENLTGPLPEPGNGEDGPTMGREAGDDDAGSGTDAPDSRAVDNDTIWVKPDRFYQGHLAGLYDDGQDWYAFNGTAGDQLDVRIKNYGFTCYYVYDDDGTQIIRRCSGATTWAGTDAARLNVRLPSNGTYHFLVATDIRNVFGGDRAEAFTTEYEFAYTFGGVAPISGTHPLLG